MTAIRYWLATGVSPQFKIYSTLPTTPTEDQIYEVMPPGHVDRPTIPVGVVEMTEGEFYDEKIDTTLVTAFLGQPPT